MQSTTSRRGSAQPTRFSTADIRAAIRKAEEAGVERTAMVLRLTLRDEAALRRDPQVALEDISYKDGGMRFLGVPVVGGGVSASSLDQTEVVSL